MIRLAKYDDLNRILNIYEHARQFMRENGNETQWNNNYPSKELLKEDIDNGQLYVFETDNIIHGVFAFVIGEDETYKQIKEGKWLSDSLYGTIHRVASDGIVKGLLNKVIEYCETKISHLRIDTHENNKIMQHLIIKNGFIKCGIIYVEDGTPRIAYEKVLE